MSEVSAAIAENVIVDQEEIAEIRKHIEKKFSEAKVEPFPFPHLNISNFFPNYIYNKILDLNPFRNNEGVEWISKKDMQNIRTPTPYDHRKQISLCGEINFEANLESKRLWSLIQSVFNSDNWFPELVRKKYPDYFDIRFGEAINCDDFWRKLGLDLFLQQHDPGYFIGAHTDIPGRVFTCIFSFAEKSGFEEFGTQLLRHRDGLTRCSGRQHYLFDDFELAKTSPYGQNEFLLFFKTRQSFHAVKTITPDVPNRRYGMQFQCFERGAGLFRDLSHPDIMDARHYKSED